VRVDADTQTATWPGDVDLDPAVLYGLYEPASVTYRHNRTGWC